MKSIHRRILLFFLVPFALFSCATPLTVTPVTDSAKRMEFDGFSVLPPQGDNWFVMFSRQSRIGAIKLLGKQIDPAVPLGGKSFQPHTIRAKVQSQDVGSETFESQQEFLKEIRKAERANTSLRFTVLEESYSLHERLGEYCVMVDKLTEDRGVPSDPGAVYLFKYKSVICLDQGNRVVVTVGCSQRVPDKIGLIDISRDCDPFMDSLRFSKE